jgi:hypothetical protein
VSALASLQQRVVASYEPKPNWKEQTLSRPNQGIDFTDHLNKYQRIMKDANLLQEVREHSVECDRKRDEVMERYYMNREPSNPLANEIQPKKESQLVGRHMQSDDYYLNRVTSEVPIKLKDKKRY